MCLFMMGLDFIMRILFDYQYDIHSPADRGTKKHVYLPYRGAIPFWFYLVVLSYLIFFHFSVSYQPLKAYFYTSAQVFRAILAFFRSLKDQ